jgi:beta-lactamase superfamily II metal-dependent hydrolase
VGQLTHGDLRRFGGAELLRALVPVTEINTSSARFRSPGYRRLMAALEKTPGCRRLVHEGDPLGNWRVLHPRPDDRFAHGDDNALVLLGEFFGTRVLLLSDLGKRGQAALLERERDLRADIVVSGLPELGEPLCDALLDAIQPRLIVITDCEYPATKRTGQVTRERLGLRGVPVIYTRQAGGVNFEFNGSAWKLTTMDGQHLGFPGRTP